MEHPSNLRGLASCRRWFRVCWLRRFCRLKEKRDRSFISHIDRSFILPLKGICDPVPLPLDNFGCAASAYLLPAISVSFQMARPDNSTWAEWISIRAGLLLFVIGLSTVGFNLFGSGVHENRKSISVLPDLRPVERIDAAAGDLSGFNVLIITSDTTRADHLHCYGNRKIGTPVIDSLARNGILCSHAISPSSSTLPAHSSLMTGLYPVHHGVRANGTFQLDDNITTLAERLKSSGYRTGAAISAFVLDSRFGLAQGFDQYFDDLTKGIKYSAHMFRERAAELTNEPVFSWLRETRDEPFFLWVHYFDPHAVYLPPEPYRSQYSDNLYDGEIAYTDAQIGALLDELKRLGVYEKTLIIFTSDHGEGLGEHGELTHSLLIYDSTLHVPMIFSAPARLPKGKSPESANVPDRCRPDRTRTARGNNSRRNGRRQPLRANVGRAAIAAGRNNLDHDIARLGTVDWRTAKRLQIHFCTDTRTL